MTVSFRDETPVDPQISLPWLKVRSINAPFTWTRTKRGEADNAPQRGLCHGLRAASPPTMAISDGGEGVSAHNM